MKETHLNIFESPRGRYDYANLTTTPNAHRPLPDREPFGRHAPELLIAGLEGFVLRSGDDFVLQGLVEVAETIAVPCHANNQIPILFREGPVEGRLLFHQLSWLICTGKLGSKSPPPHELDDFPASQGFT